MNRLIFLLFFVSVSLNVSAQGSSTYTNAEGKYTLKPLSGWTVRASGNETSVYAPADGAMDSWDEKLVFSVTDGEDIELNDAFDFYINTDFPAAYGKFNVIDRGSEEINGLKTMWATFTFSVQGTASADTGSGDSTLSAMLQALFYVIKEDNSLYLVNGVTEKNLFPKFESSFRTIIRTFRLQE